MPSHRWNLSKWMDYLGFKRPDQPEFVHAIQPVTIVGDHSALTAPIFAPMAWIGGRRGAVAGVYSTLQVTSQAPGGTIIREVRSIAAANQYYRFHLTQSPGTLANVLTLLKYEMADVATTSTVAIGTLAAPPVATSTVPELHVPVQGQTVLVDAFYIRPGWTLELWNSNVNALATFSVLFEDLPAQPVSA